MVSRTFEGANSSVQVSDQEVYADAGYKVRANGLIPGHR